MWMAIVIIGVLTGIIIFQRGQIKGLNIYLDETDKRIKILSNEISEIKRLV